MGRIFESSMPVFLAGLVFWGLFAGGVPFCHAGEIETRYGTIEYTDQGALRRFNRQLYMGRLSAEVKSGDTIEEEVRNKIELVALKVMEVLDMYVPDLEFGVVIRANPGEVQADFKALYERDVGYIAFYAPAQNTAYFSARHASLRVVAHELGHVVAEHYFDVSPPARIHEVIAQYAEKNIAR